MRPPISSWLDLIKRFEEILCNAAQERSKRDDFVDRDGETWPEWVFFERKTMTAAVNAERQKKGLPAVPPSEVIRVERQASGHSDYSHKFALYCAELAIGKGAQP
jgi:uncharacterized protein YkwD